jgi:hypothetical protein
VTYVRPLAYARGTVYACSAFNQKRHSAREHAAFHVYVRLLTRAVNGAVKLRS